MHCVNPSQPVVGLLPFGIFSAGTPLHFKGVGAQPPPTGPQWPGWFPPGPPNVDARHSHVYPAALLSKHWAVQTSLITAPSQDGSHPALPAGMNAVGNPVHLSAAPVQLPCTGPHPDSRHVDVYPPTYPGCLHLELHTVPTEAGSARLVQGVSHSAPLLGGGGGVPWHFRAAVQCRHVQRVAMILAMTKNCKEKLNAEQQ